MERVMPNLCCCVVESKLTWKNLELRRTLTFCADMTEERLTLDFADAVLPLASAGDFLSALSFWSIDFLLLSLFDRVELSLLAFSSATFSFSSKPMGPKRESASRIRLASSCSCSSLLSAGAGNELALPFSSF